ncbi:MAG: STAS domain-containing protein [bacterium]|nr:STAS domain-containing protein [bacterium]
MEINIDALENVTIIHMKGKLDGITAQDAYEKILPKVECGCHLVFDMKECDYVSSAGLRTILMLGKQIKKGKGKGVMANLSEEVREVMEMTGFDHIFDGYDSIDAAVKAILT